MPTSERDEPIKEQPLADLLRPVIAIRAFIARVTVVVTLAVAVIAAAYLVWQPSRWTASIGFRPIFQGADGGEYPNKLKFSASDVVDPSIADQVFDKNLLQDYCPREEFRSGLTVELTSVGLQLLALEYQARLSDNRISLIDRQRIQEEYGARRQAIPVQYRLTFIRPALCSRLPPPVAYKALNDMLQTWADDSENKRGVLKLEKAVLTPAIFDTNEGENRSLMVRADLIRSALMRVNANMSNVMLLPGSTLIRLPKEGTSFEEVRLKILDLIQAQLDPLIAIAGRGLGSESIAWVEQALKVATADYKLAEDKANTYSKALREYSGLPANSPSATVGGSKPATPTDLQAVTPQIEGTFVDRIVSMSQSNSAFRQEVTRELVTASLSAVVLGRAVEHYRQLLESLRSPQGASLAPAEVAQRLDSIVATGKELTRRFGLLYDEFSRVSLRTSSAMYRIEDPVSATAIRSFGRRDYVVLVAGVFFMTPVLLALGVLVRDRWRRFMSASRATNVGKAGL